MRITNEVELLQITGVTVLSLLVYSSGYKQTLLNDFAVCILPQYYAIIYPDRLWDLYVCLAMMIDWNGLRRNKPNPTSRSSVIDYLRFTISVIVVTAIYAVDFSIFDVKLRKTDFFGISLMDVGVGSFIYNAGVMGHKNSSKKYLKACPFLVALGFIRYLVVRGFDLEVNPREYGMHLNFYFLLAFVNIVYCFIRSKYNFVLGFGIMFLYEVVLKTTNFTYFVLSDSRNNLLEKNKEGLVAIIPYLSIFLMSTEIGSICFSSDSSRRKAAKTSVLTVLFGCFYVLFSVSSSASRRVGNAAFTFWILMLHSFHMSCYMFLENVFELYDIQTSKFCSSSMMFVFLFSNLLVLFGNVFFDPFAFSPLGAHMSLLSYLILVFIIPPLLFSKFSLYGFKLHHKR